MADHGSHNRILENAIEGKGIQVNPGQVAAMIARNTSTAAGDGIVVYEPSTILQGNAAAVSAPNGAVDRGACHSGRRPTGRRYRAGRPRAPATSTG